ncbi:MAG: gliding motility-associated ABC transporter permease subunit GldF [Bacteroidetes bacterium]|nr:gliding motility-associated ABC transporter permease subunit GldF [Bacteroidota bacterium]
MFALFKKEFGSFLNTFIGAIVLGSFVLVNGLFLWVFSAGYNILDNGYATIDGLFSIAPITFLFLIPAITMRFFAEEKKSGTIELLLTKPLTELQVVLGKYLAAFALVFVALIPTFIWVVSVYFWGFPKGNIDLGGTWGSYIGLLFIGGAFAAIGVWASTLTDNQAAAFLIATSLCAFFYLGFETIAPFFGKAELFVQLLGANAHYLSLSRGVIDSRDVVFFLSAITLFIALSRLSLERRKW